MQEQREQVKPSGEFRLVFEHFARRETAPPRLYRVRLKMAPGDNAMEVTRYYETAEALQEFLTETSVLPFREIVELAEYELYTRTLQPSERPDI